VINNIKMGYTTTATAAGTTTLTVASNYRQFFTGTSTQTIVLPVTSTLVTGIAYEIENNSTGLLTVNSSGGNLVGTIPAGVCAHAVCIGTTLTTAADWDWDYISTTTITGTGANVLGTSPTITTPTISSLSSASATALTLQSAGTTAITVDTSQLVGIGTTSPSSYGGGLVVRKSNTAQGVTNATAQFSDATNSALWIGHTSGAANIVSEQAITFGNTNGSATTERMRINAGAPILCLSGGSTTATGTGIAFPATQSASSDANTLDDYEEGTWTPTWVGSGSNPTQSGAPACGYVKVGRLVTVFGDFYCTSLSGGSGNLSIGGLPFTVANTATAYSGFSLGLTNLFTATAAPRVGFTNINTTNVNLYTASSSDARTNYITTVTVSGCGLTAFSEIYFNFSYLASA
jgi:hypothetical protein